MRIGLYCDEDSMDRALVRALRARGVDVVTALEVGLIEKSDAEHLEFATAQGRALYSFNVADFYRLHTLYLKQGDHHAGMVLSRQQEYSVGDQMRRLLRIIAEVPPAGMRDRVIFLSAWG